ncbi:MAG: alpha/beta hydrolase [Alphaproteobacteria bacterium]|nr:alpha/beta hydrolase [Alphaproteobacteria bacterium]MBT4018773.1 alpha/beta hydrolase [Alphaproteobacteria bacterium]MBT4966362.1 alpha/beta hydrolase [Alphaproteobacteria bacterium]MBT5160188.1 alpha/beta hydrolase [Alphaproteobacteria bacterium]MBT5919064.1 alpha/beta hydrolase [Alphaproteobacteria bacterium]
MSKITTDDGVELYYEETGSGLPIVFVHEFAGDYRSWEPQVRHFARTNRCITFSARGFLPSDVPQDPDQYSQDRARDDILAILDGLKIDAAHIIGLSMGGFAALHFGLHYPDRTLSLVVAGCGYGAGEDTREQFRRETTLAADQMESQTMDVFGAAYAVGPTRVQFKNKDPRGWQEFEAQLREHSSLGSANTMRGVQRSRPSLYDLEEGLSALTVPMLVLNGDEDDPCLDVSLYLKRQVTSSALVLLPRTGHTCNLEEPQLFNQACENFIRQVDGGSWTLRDARSITKGILSTTDDP